MSGKVTGDGFRATLALGQAAGAPGSRVEEGVQDARAVQFHWRGSGVLVDYAAVRSVTGRVKDSYSGRAIGYPRIGAGLGGGDWDRDWQVREPAQLDPRTSHLAARDPFSGASLFEQAAMPVTASAAPRAP